MKRISSKVIGWGLAASLLVGTAPTWAMQSGKTPQGWPYVSGGVAQGGRRALHVKRDAYSLWLVTAASKSGAYLADVRVTIRDARRAVVFDRRLDGPWLFIDLPQGRYQLEATLGGDMQKGITTIHRGDHRQAFFYFDTGDELRPESPSPIAGNVYGGKQ
jgi:hypothetical protein